MKPRGRCKISTMSNYKLAGRCCILYLDDIVLEHKGVATPLVKGIAGRFTTNGDGPFFLVYY